MTAARRIKRFIEVNFKVETIFLAVLLAICRHSQKLEANYNPNYFDIELLKTFRRLNYNVFDFKSRNFLIFKRQIN